MRWQGVGTASYVVADIAKDGRFEAIKDQGAEDGPLVPVAGFVAAVMHAACAYRSTAVRAVSPTAALRRSLSTRCSLGRLTWGRDGGAGVWQIKQPSITPVVCDDFIL